MMRIEKSFNVQIWVGLRSGYGDYIHGMNDVREICDKWIHEIKDCVSITPTEFRYVNGWEPGVIVGYIGYPRFLRSNEEILDRALRLAEKLRIDLHQQRVTVTTPETSYLLEDE